MKQIWRVARREVQGYFDHATAYILLVAFLLVANYIAFRTLYGSGVASLRTAFTLLPWLFALFIPAIAMRAFAEERRSGTLEWLAAQPITVLELLLGKYLGSLLFALTTLAATLPTAVGLLLVSDADPGIIVAQYLGGGLLAAQMTAIGVWASSITRTQVTAFIVGFALCWGLVFAGENLVLTNLPPAAAAVVADLSVLTHFERVARGVLDLRDVLYFLTTAALFGVLAYLTLAGERLSRGRGQLRRLRVGVAAIVLGVFLLNGIGARLGGRLDLSSQRLYTLADETVLALRGLDDLVTIKLFASRALPPEVRRTLRDVRDLLTDMRAASRGKVRFSELQPDASSEAEREAAGHGLRPVEFSILRGDEFQVKRGWFGLVVLSADKQKVYPVLRQIDDLEYRLVASIVSLTTPATPRVTFLTGFDAGTPHSYNAWREILENRFRLSSVYADSGASPRLSRDSIDVLVVAGPRRTIAPSVVDEIARYLDAGGPTLFLVDRTPVGLTEIAEPVRTGLEPLLEQRGVRLGEGIVFDLRSNERTTLGEREGAPYVTSVPLWPRALPVERHPLTSGLSALSLAWPTALELTDTAAARALWATTEAGGRYLADRIPVGPGRPFRPDTTQLTRQIVAAAVVHPAAGEAKTRASGRLVVVGDVDFLEDRFAKANVQNLLFATNALEWLAQDETLIRIRSKDRSPPPLLFRSAGQRDLLMWGNLAGVPILVTLLGAARLLWRRRRAGRRWHPDG
jgi:ABC-2 type transport system permease protein